MIEKKKEEKGQGFGIAGFVIAIVSIFLGPIGLITGLIAVILCIVQLKKNSNGLAIAGLVISIIAILISVAMIILFAALIMYEVPSISDQIEDNTKCFVAVQNLKINQENTCKEENITHLEISLLGDAPTLKGIAFFNEGILIEKSYDLPTTMNNKTYEIEDGLLNSISVSPIVEYEGEERVCQLIGSYVQLRSC